MNIDLKNYPINTADGPVDQEDYSASVIASDCYLEIVFRNQKERLLELIQLYPYVCGCVAWLTDIDVLSAMADNMEHVSIIVQKEDFLRSDLNNSSDFYMRLRKAYKALPTEFRRINVAGIVADLSLGGDLTLDPIRCMGNYNSDKELAFPRMHNKFLVFTEGYPHDMFEEELLEFENEAYWTLGISDSACVWTGSYNISNTATKSLENVVIIHNEKVAQAYFDEWNQITALSEPLDWESKWCEPQWRIGT